MADKGQAKDRAVRPLHPDDLDRVVAIDKALTGQSRRRFYERRLQSAQRHPEDFVYVGVTEGETLVGFAFAHIQYGEFGRDEAIAQLDVIGVDPQSQGSGVGRRLCGALIDIMQKKKVRSVQTQASWRAHRLLAFFDYAGFSLAPRTVLERPVNQPFDEAAEAVV